jgi:hypothetical protein
MANGSIPMDQNRWNSAELLVLRQAIRTLIVLMVVISTVDVVRMVLQKMYQMWIKTVTTTFTARHPYKMQLHGQHWDVPLLVQQRETPLLFLEQLLLLLDIHLVRLHALLMEVRLQLLLQPNVLQLLVTQDTAMLVIRPLYPLWLQTKVVPTKTGGLMAMD